MNQQQAIFTQPGTVGPSDVQLLPGPPIGCPPGLEYLTQVDQLLCHQLVEVVEAMTGFETNNKYAIKNSLGQQVFFASEESSFFMRHCCSNRREFTMHVTDNFNKEVIRVNRPFKCCVCPCFAGMCTCCAGEVFVESPPGQVIGSVLQLQGCCKLDFAIRDAHGDCQLIIKGPRCQCRCGADIEFPVFSQDGTIEVGKITKQWSGTGQEAYSNADNFGVTFPLDLDVRTKATLLGALFLVDFLAFEHPKQATGHPILQMASNILSNN